VNSGRNRRDRSSFNDVIVRATVAKTQVAASLLTRSLGLPHVLSGRFFAAWILSRASTKRLKD
jgi:hypothetical protein